MKKSIVLLLLVLAVVSSRAQEKDHYIDVDGLKRHFIAYIPINMAARLPLVIALHGRLGSGRQMMRSADFRPLADSVKFMIIYPDGIDRSWNDGRDTPAHEKGIDDVKFIRALIDFAINNFNADGKRVYITGMSNGGFMASRIACELSDKIAAAAVVAASLDIDGGYKPVAAKPVMYIQGTADPLVPFAGGPMRNDKGSVYSHEQTLKLWADAAGCNAPPATATLPDDAGDRTSIVKEVYTNRKTGIRVVGFAIEGGGHNWPGAKYRLPKIWTGRESLNINACDVIWNFCKGYSLNETQ